MRGWCLALLLILPGVAAEFGAEDAQGWPIGADGFRHDPALTVAPEALAHIQARAVEEGMDPLNRIGPATIYPYYPIVKAEVERLAAEYPDLVTLHVIGRSELGLDMWFLEIAAGAEALPLDEREVVWIDGGTHSNEFSGVYFTLAVAQYLIESYGEDEFATWVVDNRHTWILPMVNVDGSHAMGRLNANLVNINRNYPVVWDGEGNDALMNNRGPSPASEAETQINIRWFEHLMPDYYASVHCCGNLWLYPYGEEGVDPIDEDLLSTVCDLAFPEVREDCGPIWSTIYPASGSSVDTVYEVAGSVAFGFEMSGRSNLIGIWGEPVTFSEVFEQERESWQGIRHAFENVHLYGAHIVVEESVVEDGVLRLALRNDGYGNMSAGNVTLREGPARALPPIAAGATAHVGVPWDGEDQAAITYEKRLIGGRQGSIEIPLQNAVTQSTPAPAVLPWITVALILVAVRRQTSS